LTTRMVVVPTPPSALQQRRSLGNIFQRPRVLILGSVRVECKPYKTHTHTETERLTTYGCGT
jgi:hypothetical protein